MRWRRDKDPKVRKQARYKDQESQISILYSKLSDEEKIRKLEYRMRTVGLFVRPCYQALIKLKKKVKEATN